MILTTKVIMIIFLIAKAKKQTKKQTSKIKINNSTTIIIKNSIRETTNIITMNPKINMSLNDSFKIYSKYYNESKIKINIRFY